MRLKSHLLICLFLVLPVSAFSENPHRLITGGPARFGGYNLTDNGYSKFETSISYNSKKLENSLGKMLLLEYYYERFGLGVRWMSYQFEGDNETLEQNLTLDFVFLITSLVFLEGDFLHPLLQSRIGISVGSGRNDFQLYTKNNSALIERDVDESLSSSGAADLLELFFESVVESGWGYRLGGFIINTSHDAIDNQMEPDGSSSPSVYLTVIWRY